ncbi:MAG: FG-GAP-like repeat-containing protein [Verrucomicrobiota bacterium]|nr:FG-GAP-like repeat-containing protein [Verrucomicrobiota bacterium]
MKTIARKIIPIAFAVTLLVSCGRTPEPVSLPAKTVYLEQLEKRDNGQRIFDSQPFTGRAVSWHSKDQLSREHHFQNGVFHGTVREWYANGQPKMDSTFERGRPEGRAVVYHENGKPERETPYRSGLRDGEEKSWNIQGELMLVETWRSGERLSVRETDALRSAVAVIEEERQELDSKIWSEEVKAQEYEETFVALWDGLRAAKDKGEIFKAQKLEQLVLGRPGDPVPLAWGIEAVQLEDGGVKVSAEDWPAWVDAWTKAGYEVVETEWHQQSFESKGTPRSVFSFVIHARQASAGERFIVRGKLHVTWTDRKDAHGRFQPGHIEVRGVRVLQRQGAPAFELLATMDPLQDKARVPLVEPLIVADLNRDGFAEILLVGANQMYWNDGNGKFRRDLLCRELAMVPKSAVVADFTGDGKPDLLLTSRSRLPVLYEADIQGRFFGSPRKLSLEVLPLENTSACATGDVDGDGDLDVWITQYKTPYELGDFPEPYFNANDGWPSYLLLNDGRGHFTDATEAAGLAAKRHRRTWASSMVDLDDDNDLDLVVINDFAGLDYYLNDGRGRFTDVTQTLGGERGSFGMSHAMADFDGDGRLDLYMTGMGSTTARRLERMGAGRAEFPEHQANRMKLGYGNRMYLGDNRGGLTEAAFNDAISRTGWSWGCTALDADNDGRRDLFVTNGNVSGKSCKDYCTTFWRHDIYDANSRDTLVQDSLFIKTTGTVGQVISWNGFEHNVLFLNGGNGSFENVAFLMDVSHEYDSRAALSEDLDGDGRSDLLVIQQVQTNDPGAPQKLHLYRNKWPGGNHWLGVRLQGSSGVSPIGSKITIHYDGKTDLLPVVTGDSLNAQHSNNKLFGLGQAKAVEVLEIRWPNGKVTRLKNPAIDRYHLLTP